MSTEERSVDPELSGRSPGAEDEASEGTRARLAEVTQQQIDRVLHRPDPLEEPRYERSPAAVLRLLVALGAILLVVGAAELLPSAQEGLEQDLNARAGSWARGIGRLADAAATATAAVLVVASLVAAAVARRPRQLATSAVAGLVAGTLVLVFARTAGTTTGRVTTEEWQLAAVAAAIAIGGATFSVFRAPVERWAARAIALLTIVGVLGSSVSLGPRLVLLLGGTAVGAAVAALFGTVSRQVSRAELLEGLARAKLPIEELERHPGDARGSQPWTARLGTGRDVFVKVTAVDELRADQLFRLWRRVVLKRSGDERSPASVKRAAEHEAFLAQRASAAGVRTPTVIAVGALQDAERAPRGVFVVFDAIEGETLDSVGDELSDPVLRGAWSQVQIMRRAGLAHRDLRAANLLVADGEPWVIDFGFAEVAADDRLLDQDVAELLVSTAALVGPRRAVDAAVAVLGADDVAAAIPWIQPLAVSAASRSALPRSGFEELRSLVREASGRSAPELPKLQRVSWKGVLSVAALGVAIWVLLPQVASGLDVDAVLEAQPAWMAAALLAAAASYFGAAVAISGSVGGAAPLAPTFAAQVASSFTNRITPARVGGMALNLRFLTKQGLDGAVAAAGVGVSAAVGSLVHVSLTFVAVVWAGNTDFPGLSMPSARVLTMVGVALALGIAALALVPFLRRWCLDTVFPALRRSGRAIKDLTRSPRSLAMVLGGTATVTITNVVALGLSLRAFGEALPWATVAVVYLAGAALASAAPTPGGLGATEAALVGGLTVVGVSERVAVPGVLLFRLVTFWLPILPGWISFVILQRRGDI